MMETFINVQETFHGLDKETQSRQMGQYTEGEMDKMLDYMYDNLNAFRLLLDASYGTRFHNFVDELVRIEVEYTYKYMEVVGRPAGVEDAMAENLLHIVTTSYFEGMFEVIRHGMGREEAKRYIAQFDTAMDDDFNTADAISAIFDLVKFANTHVSESAGRAFVQAVKDEIVLLSDICGLIVDKQEEILDAQIEELILERQAARKAKNFARADEIRDTLAAQGIILEDTREGVKWKRA